MNVSQLQPANPGRVQRLSKEADSQDAEVCPPCLAAGESKTQVDVVLQFLSFKLLNKRGRVRLSPNALDLESLPGKGQLLALANYKAWFAAVVRAPEGERTPAYSMTERALIDGFE
jgi:nucleoporin NUP159